MRDYGRVYAAFWTNQDMRSVTDDGRLLALYLLTSPHTTLIGAFRLPDGYIAEDLQWGSERVAKGLAELSAIGFASRCESTKWVWIRAFISWNAPENPNQWKAARKLVGQIPDSCGWRAEFIEVFREAAADPPTAPSPAIEPSPNPSATVSKSGSGSGSGTETGAGSESQSAREKRTAVSRGTRNQPDATDPGRVLTALQVVYPKGTYRQSEWLIAQRHALARLEEGETLEALIAGCSRYAAQCEAKGSIASQYVLSPAKFFVRGPGGAPAPYQDPFPLPAAKETATERLLGALDRPTREVIEHDQPAAVLR